MALGGTLARTPNPHEVFISFMGGPCRAPINYQGPVFKVPATLLGQELSLLTAESSAKAVDLQDGAVS